MRVSTTPRRIAAALLDVVDDRKHEPATAGKDQPTFREAVATTD